jgi:guanylate kinase
MPPLSEPAGDLSADAAAAPEFEADLSSIQLSNSLSKKARGIVLDVWRENYACGATGSGMSSSVVSARWRLANYLREHRESCKWGISECERHIDDAYGDLFARSGCEHRRLHVIVCGFSTCGKSTLCDSLEKAFPGVAIMRRATTLREPSPDEAERFVVCDREVFMQGVIRSEIVAAHKLRHEYYGFYSGDINECEPGSIVVYQTGWEAIAILELLRNFEASYTGEPYEVFVLNPGTEVLRSRLSESRDRKGAVLERDLLSAEGFYREVAELKVQHRVIESTAGGEHAAREVLCHLEKHFGGTKMPDGPLAREAECESAERACAEPGEQIMAAENSGQDTTPSNLPQFFIRILWGSRWRMPLIILAALFGLSFVIWNSLPDDSKLRFLEYLGLS